MEQQILETRQRDIEAAALDLAKFIVSRMQAGLLHAHTAELKLRCQLIEMRAKEYEIDYQRWHLQQITQEVKEITAIIIYPKEGSHESEKSSHS